VDRERAIAIAEARQLPGYVRETFIGLLVRDEPVPPLPGEINFREADWLGPKSNAAQSGS